MITKCQKIFVIRSHYDHDHYSLKSVAIIPPALPCFDNHKGDTLCQDHLTSPYITSISYNLLA